MRKCVLVRARMRRGKSRKEEIKRETDRDDCFLYVV